MRLGLFGGTFDPIHVGHLDVAAACREALALDRVVFVPASVPPHRSTPCASAAHRFAMAALALQDDERFTVSDLEMAGPSPSYTSATLDKLAALGIETRALFVITGADAFREIGTWKDYPRLLDRCHFVVVSRPGVPAPSLRLALPALSGRMIEARGAADTLATPHIVLLDAPTSSVSSTSVRNRVAQGASLAGLVPDAVARYIVTHRLYKADTPTEW